MIIDIRGTGISYFLWASKRQVWHSLSEKTLRVHQLARWMGLKETPFNKIWLDPCHHQEAEQLLPVGSTYIAFAPTANWDKKCWPLEHFVDLGKKLLQDKKKFPNGKIIILGTSDQRANLDSLFKAFKPEEIIDLMGQVSLPTLSACLSRCALFVGNDSGLMHLASASNTPTIGLFGPSPVDVYGPWGEKTASISLNDDQSEILGRIEKGESVMRDITVDSVHKKINELLKNS
ncbi:MAG: glycosyltransferase family 9 protein [Alphaproteobacteria bacterium]